MSNQDFVDRAARVLPGGVLGSHKHAPGLEFVVKDARGAYLWDIDGRRYFDYLLGSGPMVLGHSHPAVVEAVQKQVPHGSTFMLLNERHLPVERGALIGVSPASARMRGR